jgi:hypothetical protein
MKETFRKKNGLSLFAMNSGFLSVFLLAPISQLDSCHCRNGCLINDVCHDDGSVNPGNACEVCDAAQNSTEWIARAEGTSCDYCLHCSEHGTCTDKNDNCCSTANFRSAGCAPPPVMFLETGCVFSHSEYHPVEGPPGSNWFAGTSLSLICEDTGRFDIYDVSHSLPTDCPGCFLGISESWRTSMCSIEFESDNYQCSEPTCEGGCLIGGSCFADGAYNPENRCMICDASLNTWVPLPDGAACDVCVFFKNAFPASWSGGDVDALDSIIPVDSEETFKGLPSIRVAVSDPIEWWWDVHIAANEQWQPIDLTPYVENGSLEFNVKGAQGGEQFQFGFLDIDSARTPQESKLFFDNELFFTMTSDWQHVSIPLNQLFSGALVPLPDGFNVAQITKFGLMDGYGPAPYKKTFWINDIRLISPNGE